MTALPRACVPLSDITPPVSSLAQQRQVKLPAGILGRAERRVNVWSIPPGDLMRRIICEDGRAKIRNHQLWGLLWGPLIHLGASRHISNQLATTTELVERERVAGLSAFRSTS